MSRILFNLAMEWHHPLFYDNSILISDIKKHEDFLIQTYSRNERDASIAAAFLLKIQTRKAFYILLPRLLAHCFQKGETLNIYGQNVSQHHGDILKKNPSELRMIMTQMESLLTVSDINSWLNNQPKDSLVRRYLLHLLSRKTVVAENLPNSFPFIVEMKNKDNKILSSKKIAIPLDQNILADCVPMDSRDPHHRLILTMRLDQQEWQFKLDSVRVDLRPSGVIFDAKLPWAWTCEIELLGNFRGHTEPLIWSIRHADETMD